MQQDFDMLRKRANEEQKTIIDIVNLNRLDLEARQTLALLLLLPFCVLLTTFMRYVLGFYPYGTFTSTLLALAMVYADIEITLVVGGVVIFLALLGRALLPKDFSRVPRLSLIFTFVVFSMVMSISVLEFLSIKHDSNIVMLPIIILVTIVDRFYSYMDKVDTHAAVIRLGVTVFLAASCLPLFGLSFLEKLILSYPEIHFITAALIVMISSYNGKKLTDLPLLRLLGENKTSKKKVDNKPEKTALTSEHFTS